MYEIEPIGYSRRSPAEALVANYPFAACPPGNSFFVPDAPANEDGSPGRNQPIPVNAAIKLLGRAFKVRDEVHPVTGVAGRRVYALTSEQAASGDAE